MSAHFGRSFTGHRLEDGCACPQAPCGLVDSGNVLDDCPQHGMGFAKTVRQGHMDVDCPSARFHHFNAVGTAVVCTAPDAARCRMRPRCDSETWNLDGGCDEHEGSHPVQPGPECWMAAWINSTDLQETFADWDDPPQIVPGAAITIEFIGADEGCSWAYVEVTP